jgi:hypothetical protein
VGDELSQYQAGSIPTTRSALAPRCRRGCGCRSMKPGTRCRNRSYDPRHTRSLIGHRARQKTPPSSGVHKRSVRHTTPPLPPALHNAVVATPWSEFELVTGRLWHFAPRSPQHAPNASYCLVGGLWVDDSADWVGLYVLNTHTGTSRAHPARFWEPAAKPKTYAGLRTTHANALSIGLGVPVPAGTPPGCSSQRCSRRVESG